MARPTKSRSDKTIISSQKMIMLQKKNPRARGGERERANVYLNHGVKGRKTS